MFKLESYVAPLLISYINKYVKLNKDDFKMSLWGGDVVLNKLELRLDVIENLIKIPISLKSGWVHELRVHVPWTHLYSEPVVITINTIECSVKLKNWESSSDSTSLSSRQSSASTIKKAKSLPIIEGHQDLPPPGYLQSLLNKIVNNINIIVNNLILKFVDDDIVLSLNVKSAECFSANAEWHRSFIELMPEDLILRRVLEIHDLTLCLDQRSASGKIEHYQTPVLYRCVLRARLALVYESLYSKLPCLTKLNIVCDTFNVSFTDIQIPMFERLLKLLNFYRESSNISDCSNEADEDCNDMQGDASEKMEDLSDQDWVSWAWSYVPPIFLNSQESDPDIMQDTGKKSKGAILIIGFHIRSMLIHLKHSVISRTRGQIGFEKMSFVPYMLMNLEKLNLDMRFKGNSFIDVQFGISNMKSYFQCDCLVDLSDEKVNDSEVMQFFEGGESVFSVTTYSQFHKSLFGNDYEIESFPTSEDEHILMFSEDYARRNFSFFWMNFVSTIQIVDEGNATNDLSSLNELGFKERLLHRFYVGKSELKFTTRLFNISNHLCALLSNNEIFASTGCVEPKPSGGDISQLELNAVSSRYFVSFFYPKIYFYPVDTELFDHKCQWQNYLSKINRSLGFTSQGSRHSGIPVIVAVCERLDFVYSVLDYPRHSGDHSIFGKLSGQDLKKCYSSLSVKVDRLNVHLQLMDREKSEKKCVIQPMNLKLQQKSLVHCNFWKEPLQPEMDWLLEGENLTFNLTKPQICVISYIFGSWIFQPADHKAFDSLSLIKDVFYEKSPSSLLSIEVTIPSFEFHYMENKALYAFSGCITSILALMLSCENEKQFLLPLLYGPLDLTELSYGSSFFCDSSKPLHKESLGDLITISCQINKNSMLTGVYQGIFIKILGISVLLDPILYDWLAYFPKQLFRSVEESIMLDAEVLLATDPLNSSCFGSESGSHNMEQATAMTSFNDSKLPLSDCHTYFTTIYHLIKSLEVEINVGNSCLFMPSKYIFSTSPTVNIPVMLLSLYNSGSLPEVFVIVFPKIDIMSMGSSNLVSPPPIPIKTPSVAGEKLPWKLILSSMSMYSVHGSGMVISFMDSLTICSTLALNLGPLEKNHASDMVMYHKSLCLHCDTDLAHLSLCSKQIVLFEDLSKKLGTAMKDNVETFNCLVSLLNIKRSFLRNNFSLANPSQSYQDTANISEGLSDDLSFHIKDEQTPVQDKVSVWLQFTISKLILEIPHFEQLQRESVLECEIVDIANSLDISGFCVNFKSKINSICVKEIFGQHELILMVTEVCLPQHLMFALASKVSSKGNSTHIGNACHASSASKKPEFLNFSFTRIHENSLFNRFVKDCEKKMLKLSSQNMTNGNMNNLDEVCIMLQPFVTFFDFESLLALTNFIEILSDFANLFGGASSPAARNIEATFITSELPLIHLSIKCFYAFFHGKHNGSNFSTDEENIEDALVVYVDYFEIVPYADNPLPRLVIDKNLYAKVIQLDEFGPTPGCLLENRQYQAHVQGLTFASTSWKNILKESKFKSDLLVSSDVQNPAFEWNSNLRSSNVFYVGLLTSALSIQIIFAPAIVCQTMHPEKKLVCGYSIEINLTSELEISLTISRMSLLVGLANGAIELSSKSKSGFGIGMQGIASHNLPKTSSVSSMVPFDLLVTGIRLNVAFMQENLMCANSQKKYKNYSEFTVRPILCCLISQPYFIFKYDDMKMSKLEVSCYDASIKSGNPTSPNNIRFVNVCPSYSDFVDFMLETKQGKPDDTTGVLSSLFTCTISNYLCDEAEIVVKIERPVKISYTKNHHEMLSTFISDLWDCLEVSKYRHDKIPTLEHNDDLNTYNSLKWLKSASCTVGQLVLHWIIELGESKTALMLSVKNLNFDVIPQNMKKMSCNAILTNLALTVSSKEQMFRIFGPSTIKAQLVLHSYEISQMPRNPNCLFIPSIDVHLCSKTIILQFSKDSISCLNEILRHLSMGTGDDSNDGYSSEPSDKLINERYGLLNIEYENDLKSNLLSFVHKEDCGVPACGEITFQTDICCSAMTWKYHEPRIISKLAVIPVPFQINESFIKNANKEFEGISCILQYSLDDGINFRNYTTFEVGRNVFVEISLPSISDSCLVASCLWKVLLIKHAGNHNQNETIDELQRNRNFLSPLVLASCLRIDSKIIPHLIPTMTLTFSSEKLEAIFNYSKHNKSGEKAGGKKCDSLPNHRVASLGCRASSIYFQTFLSDIRNTIKLDVVSELELQIIEYINLTWSKVFQEMLFESNVLIDKKNSLIELACNINKSHVMISQEVGHTLDLIYNLWNEPNFSYIASCCLIHNNTQEELYFGQVGTEEILILPPLCIYQYFWSCWHRSKELWLGIEKYQKEIQNSMVLDRNSPVKKIELSDGRNLYANFDGNFKIEIEGNLTLGNNLDFGIYIKMELEGNIRIKKMNPKELLPSFVLAENKLEKVTICISLKDSETWSEEIILGTYPKKHLIEMFLNSRHIHIWCEILIQNGPDKPEYLVLFSPLFAVRSHYPLRLFMNVSLTKSMNSFQIDVGGKGKMTLLHCSHDFPLHITLQLHPEISPSKPVLAISSKMATDVIEKDFKGKYDIRQIIHEWNNETMIHLDQWPYNAIDESVLSCTQSNSLNCSDDCVDINFPTPNIELSINLSQYASYSNTLMVELAPHWMIINESNLDLIIYHCNTSEFWSFSSSKAFVPPMMEQFTIMILMGGTLHSSDIITLLNDELSSPYQCSDDLHLAVESHATFSIPVICDGKIIKRVYLTIHSTWKHNMRIITIKEQFTFVNNLPYVIQLLGVVCHKNQTQIEVDESTQPTDYINMSVDKQEVIQSMLMWNFQDFDESLPQTQTSFVVCMRLSSTKNVSDFPWSSPICLEVGLETSCHRVVVPCNENILDYHELMESVPCCVTVRVEKCLVYLVLDYEKQAYLRVHNSCHFLLYLASPQISKVVNKKTISSQATIVKANSSGYFCPSLMSQATTFFPFTVIVGSLDPMNSDVVWSLPFEIHESLTSSIIRLGKSDIKIELKIRGLLCYIDFSSLMRADVLEVKKVTQTDSFCQQFSKSQVKLSSLRHITTSDCLNEQLWGSFKIKIAILCRSLFWALIDDTFKGFSTSKITTRDSQCLLLLAMDDIFLLVKSLHDDKVDHSMYHLEISVGDMQIDNKAFDDGSFDFPVVMLRSQEGHAYRKYQQIYTPYDAFKYTLKDVFFRISSKFVAIPKFQVLNLSLCLLPFSLSLEDTFIYRFIEYICSFKDYSKSYQCNSRKISYSLVPADVRLISNDFSNPIRLQRLLVEPVRVLISIHASLKIFVAVDSTPMNFGKFERVDILLTKQQLSKLLTMHYASSALLRAGVIIGSLEILGNPTGFVRNITNGVFDMIFLPYNGLALGPASCIIGFSNGIKSVVKHFSAGTFTSISNFASGISRNMERLSMDEDHIDRFERMRRRKPQGLTQGLSEGLAGFGLSLLGAIAGLADQPLQVFMGQECLSVSSWARGIVAGIGKGLIGMIAKPIGGAAELVSMTSIGFMQGAGLIELYQQRDYNNCPNELQMALFNQVILTKRNMLKFPDEDFLCSLDGCSISLHNPCAIILTTSVIHIWNCLENFLLCSFPISDVHLTVDYCSSELFLFVAKLGEHHPPYLAQGSIIAPSAKSDNERVTEYMSSSHLLTDSVLCPSSTKMQLKYTFNFQDKHSTAEFLSMFEYAYLNKDADHFLV